MVHAEVPPIEIAAPPERVRELVCPSSLDTGWHATLTLKQVLDFSKMPEWHTQHFKSITVPSGKNSRDLVEGDKLHVILTPGLTFSPVILVRPISVIPTNALC